MDEVIYRQIWLLSRHVTVPIEIVSGSQVPIRLEIMDYTIPAGAIAKVYATIQSGGPVYITPGVVLANAVTFTPPDGFFPPGRNRMQLELNDKIIPLSLEVICQSRVLVGEPAAPEAVKTLTMRAEEAAASAEKSKAAAASSENNAANSMIEAQKAEKNSESNAQAAAGSALAAATAEQKANGYAETAKGFADTAAAAAGAATVSIGWDADGYFSIFEQEA